MYQYYFLPRYDIPMPVYSLVSAQAMSPTSPDGRVPLLFFDRYLSYNYELLCVLHLSPTAHNKKGGSTPCLFLNQVNRQVKPNTQTSTSSPRPKDADSSAACSRVLNILAVIRFKRTRTSSPYFIKS